MTKTRSGPAASPDDLLKAAVSGGADAKPGAVFAAGSSGRAAAALSGLAARARLDARAIGISGAALCVGTLLGAGLTALAGPGRARSETVAALGAALDAGRSETARLGGDIAQLHQILADLRAGTDAARKDGTARAAALTERVAQAERTVAAKVAALGDRVEQAEREQGARLAGLAAQIDRRIAAPPGPVAAKVDPAKTDSAKAEPSQTGSLAEQRGVDAGAAKAIERAADARTLDPKTLDTRASDPKQKTAAAEKPPVIEAWALRDIYDGAAILENRHRRLVEVGRGDVVPGIGRVESVERRGRDWVVVTRQGLITPQPW